MTRASIAIVALLSCAGCTKGPAVVQQEASVAPPAAAPVRVVVRDGLQDAPVELAEAARAIVEKCRITEDGFSIACGEPGLTERLAETEGKYPTGEVLAAYCRVQRKGPPKLQLALAHRLGNLAFDGPMREAADSKLFDCLLGVVGRAQREPVARAFMQAAAYMGTALGRDDDVFAAIGKVSPAIAEVGLGAAWANGRMRVFERLAKRVRDPKTPTRQRVVVITGFTRGPALRPKERVAVCRLLSTLLADKHVDIAAEATVRFLRVCAKAKDRARVVKLAGRRVAAHDVNARYVSALRQLADSKDERPVKKARRLLSKVVTDARLDDVTRNAALALLAQVAPAEALPLARRFAKEGPPLLQRQARQILAKQAR